MPAKRSGSRKKQKTGAKVSGPKNGVLGGLRREIDAIDDQVLALLNARGRVVQKVGEYKREQATHIHVPERERLVLDRLFRQNTGPLSNRAIEAIYREIFSAAISLEREIRAAYLGPEGTFSHLAALRYFGSSAGYLPQPAIDDVFRAVEQQRADYGLVPLENSTEGTVTYTFDRFVDTPVKICAETYVEIHHHLLSTTGDSGKIRHIYSFSQPFAQCRQWLAKNMPGIEIRPATSSANAAELAAGDPKAAAIASELAADLYGLKYAARRIEDLSQNETRFAVIGLQETKPTGRDKTTLVCSVKDEPGILFRLLQPAARARINLSKIESRPSRTRKWESVFFFDLMGHAHDPKVSRVLSQMRACCQLFRVLGSYPAAR